MNTELRTNIVELLRETGRAHHEAFAATDGADPDWPIWYADYLMQPFTERLGFDFHRDLAALVDELLREHTRVDVPLTDKSVESSAAWSPSVTLDQACQTSARPACVGLLVVNFIASKSCKLCLQPFNRPSLHVHQTFK